MNKIKLVFDDDVLNEYAEHYFELHPRATKKPIPLPYHQSINTWMIMRRPAMNGLKQKWKEFVKWFVESKGYSNLHIEKCEITQRVYYSTNRRHDIDNSVPKFIIDGLVDSGMIVDDDMNHLTKLTMSCDIDKDRPRTEITITIIKELEENYYG